MHLYFSNIFTVSLSRGVVFSVFQQGRYLNHILKYLYMHNIYIRNSPNLQAQRPLICPILKNVNWSTYFHRTHLPAAPISKFTQIQFFHVARREERWRKNIYGKIICRSSRIVFRQTNVGSTPVKFALKNKLK